MSPSHPISESRLIASDSSPTWWTEAEKRGFFDTMVRIARESGYANSWVLRRYRETFGEDPPFVVCAA